MNHQFDNKAWKGQGFEILDSDGKVIDGVTRFLFRGFLISMSSWNYSRGGAFNEIVIRKSVKGESYPYSQTLSDRLGDRLGFRTVQMAINHIIDNDLDAED